MPRVHTQCILLIFYRSQKTVSLIYINRLRQEEADYFLRIEG